MAKKKKIKKEVEAVKDEEDILDNTEEDSEVVDVDEDVEEEPEYDDDEETDTAEDDQDDEEEYKSDVINGKSDELVLGTVVCKGQKESGLSKDKYANYEREIRRYVRRDGGFRKNLSAKDKERTNFLLGKVKRKGVCWDTELVLPGYDKPTVRGMVQV